MQATDNNGRLKELENCWIQIGADIADRIKFNSLPDLGDSKGATYNSENTPGRASPINTYSGSEGRTISCSFNLYVQDEDDPKRNLRILRKVQSAVYPRTGGGAPYFPPPLVQIKCGQLFSNNPLCCLMKNYNVKFPTDVPWDEETMVPYRMEVTVDLEVTFAGNRLPNSEMILKDIP